MLGGNAHEQFLCLIDANLFVLAFMDGAPSLECGLGHVCEVANYAPDIMMKHIKCGRFQWGDLQVEKEIGRGMCLVVCFC